MLFIHYNSIAQTNKAWVCRISGGQTICSGSTSQPLIATLPEPNNKVAITWQRNTNLRHPKWTNIKCAAEPTYNAGRLFKSSQFRCVLAIKTGSVYIHSISNIITIGVMQKPVAGFEITTPHTFGSDTNAIAFYNTSGWDDFGWTTGYQWNFGDGSPEVKSIHIPKKFFNEPGTFNVTLVAVGYNGCTDTVKHEVKVQVAFNGKNIDKANLETLGAVLLQKVENNTLISDVVINDLNLETGCHSFIFTSNDELLPSKSYSIVK